MADPTGYILPLSQQRLGALESQLDIADRFGEPVSEFLHSRNVPLLCFVLDPLGGLRFIARCRRGVAAGTGLRRLSLFDIARIGQPLQLNSLVDAAPARLRSRLRDRISYGGLLTRKQFVALVDIVSSRDQQARDLLARYSTARADRIAALSTEAQEQLALQKDAIGTALSIAGLDRSLLEGWEPPASGPPTSFLDGLPEAYLREDPMIVNDLGKVPGFAQVRSYPFGATTFSDGMGRQITVVLANRLPLEQLTGADLIYYNETFGSMVMVQYKAMDHDSQGRALFRLPNPQLEDEVRRMDVLLETVKSLGTPIDVTGFRLSSNPFYLKLCPRIVFQPDDQGLSRGMYIPLDKWKLLVQSKDMMGPRGGQAVTYDNVRRYFDNTTFIGLVSSAWVGSTPAQTAVFEAAITATLESGRAVVLAFDHRRAAETDDDIDGETRPPIGAA